MVFSSITFIFYFLPLCLVFYFISPNKYKNLILLVFSLFFYAWGEPKYILIMIFSSIVDYTHAIIIDKYRGTIKSKLALLSSIFINLSLLGFFKYSNFFISLYNDISSSNLALLNITLPIGISFYTFQTMSYSIDVYRNQVPVQRNLISLATYVSLFPQLVAGPIVRYIDVYKELNNRNHTLDLFYEGVCRFIIGLSKKIIFANNLGIIWMNIKSSNLSELSMLSGWLGIICFSMQIYFDFSGYSDMAIGLGKMFGFNFLENFNYPYISRSISEFWRRWHISLGIWFRDYVYIPLGGNRCSKPRWILNIFIVWFLTGFWHGASFNFIVWGLYFGLLLMIEKLFLLDVLNKIPNLFRHTYVIISILISFVIFELNSFEQISSYIRCLFDINNIILDKTFIYYFIPNISLLIISVIGCTPVVNKIINYNPISKYLILFLGLIISTSFLIDSSFNPFLYFRF